MKTNAFVADGFARWLNTGARKRRQQLEESIRANFAAELAAATTPEERERIQRQIGAEIDAEWRKLKPGPHCLWIQKP